MSPPRPVSPGGLLLAAFKIQSGEAAHVGWMVLYSAAATGGVLTVGLGVSSALFLGALPPSATPYLFILPALFIVPTMFIYNRISARRPLVRAVAGSNLLLLAITLLFRLLLETPAGRGFAALAGLFLFVEVSYTLVLLQFWTFAIQIFNPRQARRLFGLIAAGGTLANTAAGLSLGTLGQLLGVENLLFVVAGSLAVCVQCVRVLGSAAEPHHPAARTDLSLAKGTGGTHPAGVSFGTLVNAIRRSPLLLSIAGLTVLMSLLINIGAYQFYLSLQVAFAGRQTDMVAFLGTLFFWAGIAALAVQTYLTGRVMSRYGVFATLLFFPLASALGASLALLTGGALWAMTLIRAADPVFRRTINTAGLNALYLPVPVAVRGPTTDLVEAVYALTFGLAGIVFLILQDVPDWNFLYWSIPLLGLAAVWLLLLAGARAPYVRALAENIQKRRLNLAAEPIDLTDPAARRVLGNALRHADPLQVLHALHLISSSPAGSWAPEVAGLLAHRSADVRVAALAHLGQPGNAAYADAIAALFGDSDEAVRAAAIEAYCAACAPSAGSGCGPQAAAQVAQYLDDPHPRIRGAATSGLMQHGESEGDRRANGTLQQMLASGEPAIRREAARVLGELRRPEFNASLLALLDDPDESVQVGAVHAAGAIRSGELMPALIRKLEQKQTASAAADALVQLGPEAAPALATVLDDGRAPQHVRERIPRILQHLGSAQSANLLLRHIGESDLAVRTEIYHALVRLHAKPGPGRDTLSVHNALTAELRAAYALFVLRADLSLPKGADLNAEGATRLLSEALDVRMNRSLDRIFLLLLLLYPQSPLDSARLALQGPLGARRAEAVELLDNLLFGEIKVLLLALVESPAAAVLELAYKRLGITSRSAEERLAELVRSPDPWLRACALSHIGTRSLSSLEVSAREALRDPDLLVRETALAACRRLLDRERFEQLLAHQASDKQFVSSSAYLRHLLPEGLRPLA